MKTTIGNFLNQEQSSFPHDCELYAGIQENMFLVAILGNIAGDKVILYGCEPFEDGTKRNPGYVFLRTHDHPEGEVLFWEGDSVSRGMYLCKQAVAVSVEEKEYPEAYTERTLRPGIGEEMYKWSDFRDLTNVMDLLEQLKAHEKLSQETFDSLHYQDEVLQENLEQAIEELKNLFSHNLKMHEEEAKATFDALRQKDADLQQAIEELDNQLTGRLDTHSKGNTEEFERIELKIANEIKSLDQQLSGNLNDHIEENKQEFSKLSQKINNGIDTLNQELSGKLNTHTEENNRKLEELDQKVDDETEKLDKKLSGNLTAHITDNNNKFSDLDRDIENLDTRISGQISIIQTKDKEQDESLSSLQNSLNSLSTDIGKITDGTLIPKKAETAANLETARKITLTGDLTGETAFDGSQNVSIEAAVVSAPKIVNSNKNNVNNKTLSIWVGTQADYNAITTKDENTLYNII
ncbi:MAG: hypothetical protein LUE98_11415 [Tannerellaceae bacterium]|nr:hypothetical protein [Tannerellaceae bacterium]